MRRFLTALVALCLVVLTGCSCGGLPTLTLRSPVQFDSEAQTVAGPRLMAAPQYYVPTYAPAAGGCATGFAPGYSFSTPGPVGSPCAH